MDVREPSSCVERGAREWLYRLTHTATVTSPISLRTAVFGKTWQLLRMAYLTSAPCVRYTRPGKAHVLFAGTSMVSS